MHKKKRLVWILVLIALSTIVSADTYDTWTLAGDDIAFDNKIFSTNINLRWDITTVEYDSNVFLLANNTCQADALYRMCFKGTRWSVIDNYGTYNATTEVMTPDMWITIETLTPSIVITRTIDKTNLLVNDIVTINVNIRNDGEQKVYNLEYYDVIPSSFYITELNGVNTNGNTIRWSWPSLSDERSFSYELKLTQAANESWGADLYYDFEGNTIEKDFDALTIKTVNPPNPLTVSTSLSPSSMNIGDKSTYRIILDNTEDDTTIDVQELTITIPEEIVIKKNNGLDKVDNVLSWSGVVQDYENKEFEVELTWSKTGKEDILTSITNSYYNDIEKKTHTEQRDYINTLESTVEKLQPSVSFMFGDTSLEVGDESNVRAFIENTNDDIALFDIKFTVESDLFSFYKSEMEHILPGKKEMAFYYPFIAPSLVEGKTYNVLFKGSYRTSYYEYFEFISAGQITIAEDPTRTEELIPEVEEDEDVEIIVVQPEDDDEKPEIVDDVEVESIDIESEKKEGFFKQFFAALGALLKDLF